MRQIFIYEKSIKTKDGNEFKKLRGQDLKTNIYYDIVFYKESKKILDNKMFNYQLKYPIVMFLRDKQEAEEHGEFGYFVKIEKYKDKQGDTREKRTIVIREWLDVQQGRFKEVGLED